MATVTVAKKMTLVTDSGNFTPKSGPFQMDDSKAAILHAKGMVNYHGEPAADVTVDHVSTLEDGFEYSSDSEERIPEFDEVPYDGLELLPAAERVSDVLTMNGIASISALSCKTVDDLVKINGIGKATARKLLKEANAFMGNR